MNNKLVKKSSKLHLGDFAASGDKLETVNDLMKPRLQIAIAKLVESEQGEKHIWIIYETPGIVYACTHA
jgi:hypothetical protein